jgi:flagellar biosynthetic protein FliP
MNRASAAAILVGVAWLLAAGWTSASAAPSPSAEGATSLADAEREAEAAKRAASSLPKIGDLLTAVEKVTDADAEARDWSAPVKLAVVFTGLALLPAALVMMTSFTRVVIVLSFVRRALTTQNIPPNIAIIGLALFLTLFTMAPTLTRMNGEAVQPYLADEVTFQAATDTGFAIIKEFMIRHTRQGDLALFLDMAEVAPERPEEVPIHVAIPAFAVSEFRMAFQMGCLLFIPFLLIDLVVAGILLSAGMMMLPPVIISLPLKIILFVLVDGWRLLAENLVSSFY